MTAPRAALTSTPALGADIAAYSTDPLDIDPYFASASGPQSVAEAVVAAIHLTNGTLWWAADRGVDVREFLHGTTSTEDMQLAIESECLRDERVERADVSITRLGRDAQVRIVLHLRNAPTAVSLTLTVSEVNEAIAIGAP